MSEKMTAAEIVERIVRAEATRVIELGEGRYIINHGKYEGRPALFIERAPMPGSVGTDASDNGLPKDAVSEGGIVIVFGNPESAAVLGDELRAALAPPSPASGEKKR